VQEDRGVAVVRDVVFQNRIANPVQRVIEPELDMDRLRRRQLPAVSIFRELMRKLVPTRQWVMRSPMRSIAREIEEAWPSNDL
jgi:microcystin degradation protein MlrC